MPLKLSEEYLILAQTWLQIRTHLDVLTEKGVSTENTPTECLLFVTRFVTLSVKRLNLTAFFDNEPESF